MKFGSTDVSKLMVGSTTVTKGYFNGATVFDSGTPVQPTTYQNLIVNGSFEDGLNGWVTDYTNGGTLATSNTQKFHGNNSAKVSVSGAVNYKNQDVTVPEGHTVYCSEYVFIESNGSSSSISLSISNYGTSTWLAQAGANKTSFGVWQKLSALFTIPVGVTGFRIEFGAGGTSTYVDYIDAIMAVDLTAAGLDAKDLAWCNANLTPDKIIW
jgi:hypothetical protein